MKPLDPDKVPEHISRRQGGATGLVHGPAPDLPRAFLRAHPKRNDKTRRGAKARAKMKRALEARYGIK